MSRPEEPQPKIINLKDRLKKPQSLQTSETDSVNAEGITFLSGDNGIMSLGPEESLITPPHPEGFKPRKLPRRFQK